MFIFFTSQIGLVEALRHWFQLHGLFQTYEREISIQISAIIIRFNEKSDKSSILKLGELFLGNYRSGGYLPLVVIYSPEGKVNVGIRVCEPCGSWSFHVISKQLDCDSCHTRWDLELLAGKSGGCQSFPPPVITNSLNGLNIDIVITALGLIIVP